MTYPYGISASGVDNVFHGTDFSPSNVVNAIRDNHSPVNRTSLLNSIGYQLALVQNFVNQEYLGRSGVPVQNAYFGMGTATGYFMALSGDLGSSYNYTTLYPDYAHISQASVSDNKDAWLRPNELSTQYVDMYSTYLSTLTPSGLSIYNSVYGQSYLNLLANSGFTGNDGDYTSGIAMRTAIEARGTNYFCIGNYSDTGSYSGYFELYAAKLYLNSPGGFTFVGNITQTNISFDGNLLFSGLDPAPYVRFYDHVVPVRNDTNHFGISGYSWKDSYLNKIYSNYGGICTFNDGASAGTYAAGSIVTEFGAIAGSAPSISYPTFYTSLYNNSSELLGWAGIHANALLVGRTTPAVSGYLRINSTGQLEFYKIGVSGWILTNYGI